ARGRHGAARLCGTRHIVSHPAGVGTTCGGVCGCRQNWEMPGPATRALLATSIGHVLPSISRIAKALGLTVYSSPQLLDLLDGREVGGGDLFFVAEQAGWLHRLDRIGRESAVVGAAPWLGDDDLFINFNPTSIYRPQVCLASTERVVHETGIEPSRLVFEVVE